MEQKVKKKIVQLLQSNDRGLCTLAATIFCGTTKKYKDYYDIRSEYQPVGIHVEPVFARMALNVMFNGVDTSTIPAKSRSKKKMQTLRMTYIPPHKRKEDRK